MNRFTLAVCLSLLLAATSLAQSIGVSFAGDNTGGTAVQITSAQTAGIFPQSNWNAATGGEGTVSGLVDSTGSATGASVTWSSPNVWGGTGATSDEEALVNGWLDDGGGTGNSVQISGIPFSDYDVYVYGSSDGGNEGRGLTVNVNGTSHFSGGEFTTLSANGSFFNGHVNSASTNADPTYTMVTDVAGATLSIIGARDQAGPALPGGSTDYRAAVSGVQVLSLIHI